MTWVEFPTHNMNDWFKHKLYVNRDHRLSRTVGGGQNAKVLLPTHHQSTRPTYWASHTIVIWLGLCCQDEWIQEDARLVGPWPHDIHSNMEAGKRIGHTEEAAQDSHRYMRKREKRRGWISFPLTTNGPTERRRKLETHLGNLWETETKHSVSQSSAICREADQVCLQPRIIKTELFIYYISIVYTFISSYRS